MKGLPHFPHFGTMLPGNAPRVTSEEEDCGGAEIDMGRLAGSEVSAQAVKQVEVRFERIQGAARREKGGGEL